MSSFSSPFVSTRFFYVPTVLLVAMFVGGSFFLSACTSGNSADTPPDSTDTTTTNAVSEGPSSEPVAPPAEEEEGEERTVEEKLNDARIEARVKRAVFRERSLRVFPFRFSVTNGRLVLRGDVNTPDQYRRAERIAKEVEGVSTVSNRLTMGGRPVTEERLAAADDGAEDGGKENESVYHTVRPGDTLWDVARQYQSSVRQIQNLNDLHSSSRLRPGQRIRVR